MRVSGWIYLSLVCFLFAHSGDAQVGGPFAASAPRTTVQWLHGPTTVELRGVASYAVPAGYFFANEASARAIIQATGSPLSGREVGILAPTNFSWYVVFEFSDIGYVHDEEKSRLTRFASDMLLTIAYHNEDANADRVKHGAQSVRVLGWEEMPEYDAATHRIQWAIRARSGSRETVNFSTHFLGRSGVVEMSLVDSARRSSVVADYHRLAGNLSFKPGEAYGDYVMGDKEAPYGLTSLVTGGESSIYYHRTPWRRYLIWGGAFLASVLVVGGIVGWLLFRQMVRPYTMRQGKDALSVGDDSGAGEGDDTVYVLKVRRKMYSCFPKSDARLSAKPGLLQRLLHRPKPQE